MKPFLDLLNSKLGKEKKTPYLHSDVIRKCPKTPPEHKLELGNSNFRNQRTRVGKNSYVAKNQTQNARGCHSLVACVEDIVLSQYYSPCIFSPGTGRIDIQHIRNFTESLIRNNQPP